MLAVLFSTPRPPLGVAILGLTIAMLSWMLHLLPYIMFCGMITLSVWTPSHPLQPEAIYHPVDGLPNHVHVVYTRVGSKEPRSFELNAELRFLLFLLAIPVTSVIENALFHPARRFFLRTIECWFDMRYVHPAQMTGSWPDTWTPIFNALRSCEFVADFIDGITGRNSGPSLAHTAETYTPGPRAGMDDSGRSLSMAQPVDQCAPSRQCKRTSSPDPTVHSELECSTNVPRARKTFVSPPHVSSQSPWKADGLRGSSPVSKNLSRIVGTLFHHPPPRKPVIRRRINLMAKVPLRRIPPRVLERLWSRNEENVAPASASIPSIGIAIHDSVAPWLDSTHLLRSTWDHASNHLVAAAPELGEDITGRSLPLSMGPHFLPRTCEALAIERTQFEQQQCWGYAHSPLTSPPLPEPPAHTMSQDFVSDLQGEQSFQPWTMQTPLHHRFPNQDQHITPPIYRQQDLDNQQLHQPLDSVALALVQHGSHVYSDSPARPVEPRKPVFGQCASLAPVLESHLSPFASLPVAPQAQFTFQLLDHAPLFQFSEDAPHLDHSPPTTPPARPETTDLVRTTESDTTTAVFVPSSTFQDESSHSSSQPVPFDAPPEAVWSNYHHQSPTITSPVLSQPCHIERPFWGLGITESFTFDVSEVTPYFDFSCHIPPPLTPHPDGIDLDVIPQAAAAIPLPSDPQVMSSARPPISVQDVQDQQTPRDPASQSQDIVLNPLPRQPSTPTEQTSSETGDTAALAAEPSPTGANMTVDSDDDDDSSSDSDSDSDSDMDYDSDSDSSSDDDDDSDSDSDSDSSEEESDAMATETVGKASSVVSNASSKAQDDVQDVVVNKDTPAPAAPAKDDGTDSDSDSDGYFEHISTPTPPGASNNDDSSSDEDMSDHEEEYRQYWEMFYTPRHRRPPQVSVGSV